LLGKLRLNKVDQRLLIEFINEHRGKISVQ